MSGAGGGLVDASPGDDASLPDGSVADALLPSEASFEDGRLPSDEGPEDGAIDADARIEMWEAGSPCHGDGAAASDACSPT